jgi:hypothetical protein
MAPLKVRDPETHRSFTAKDKINGKGSASYKRGADVLSPARSYQT